MHNRGIGRKLIDFCEVNAKELGYKEIILWTFEKNDTARKIYEHLGYTLDENKNTIDALNAVEVRYHKML